MDSLSSFIPRLIPIKNCKILNRFTLFYNTKINFFGVKSCITYNLKKEYIESQFSSHPISEIVNIWENNVFSYFFFTSQKLYFQIKRRILENY